jgi:hypothetical protein
MSLKLKNLADSAMARVAGEKGVKNEPKFP